MKSGKARKRTTGKLNKAKRRKMLVRATKGQKFKDIFVSISCILVCYVIMISAVIPKKYDVLPGEKSPYDITAPRNAVNMVLTQKRAEQMRDQVQPVVIRTDITPEKLNIVTEIFIEIRNHRNNLASSVTTNEYDITGFQKGAITKGDFAVGIPIFSKERSFVDESLASGTKLLVKYNVDVPLRALEDIYIYASDRDIDQLEKAIRDIVTYVLKNDVFEDRLSNFLEIAHSRLNSANPKGHLDELGLRIFDQTIKPNCFTDQEHTKFLKDEAYNNVMQNNKVVINANERILSIGDVVTDDIFIMLEELNMIKDGKTNYLFYISVFLITVLLFVLMFAFYFSILKDKKPDKDNLLLIGTVIVLTLLIARFVPKAYLYATPIFIGVMLLTILTNERMAFVGNLVISLCASFMTNWDIVFMVICLCVGSIAIYFVKIFKKRRSSITVSGIIVGAISILVVVAFGMYYRASWMDIGKDAAFVFLNGFASGIITLGVLSIFESVFDVITQFKLLELSNPNQPLLKRLLLEAPGTYHHSLMVANLAEHATEAIGGDPLLARVGAYYHDIGKLKRVGFFSENQSPSFNPHDKLKPDLSKNVIMDHVKYGKELAKEYKLPSFLEKFIEQHHGTTLVAYFYHQAKENNKNGVVSEEDYRYKGKKPDSKETAVVMLADSVEAASKSLDFSEEGLNKKKLGLFIDKIIMPKYEDGQLDEVDLTFADLTKIKDAFAYVYKGHYSSRNVYYPDDDKGSNQSGADNGKDGDESSK